MNMFSFTYKESKKNTLARIGVITTPHGKIHTPAFVPVGTQAAVKSLTPDELNTLGVQLFFVNTYHTYLRPGLSVIKKLGGLHGFMNWPRPIITDSGGFQVFSLARPKFTPADRSQDTPSMVTISENGVKFRSHWDGSEHFFTPESSMEYQWILASDIHIAFDDCTSYPITQKKAKRSMERTHRWAARSLVAHEKLKAKAHKLKQPYQALYGVVQGSIYEDLRKQSARYISSMDFDGIAIGGVSVGESKVEMKHVLEWVTPLLPPEKPRHLLGVGEIDDIFALVGSGMDTFDCVQPTRIARMGRVYVHDAKTLPTPYEIDITKAIYERDTGPIDPGCRCYTCGHFSRSYVHHLFRVRELLAYRLATIHNIYFIQRLVDEIRAAIGKNQFLDCAKAWGYNKI